MQDCRCLSGCPACVGPILGSDESKGYAPKQAALTVLNLISMSRERRTQTLEAETHEPGPAPGPAEREQESQPECGRQNRHPGERARRQRVSGRGAVTEPTSAIVPLAARLRRLYLDGGSDGSSNTSRRTKRSDAEVAARLGGEVAAPGLIQVLQLIPLANRHGRVALSEAADAPLAALGVVGRAHPEGLLFLDTETTGLAGGTGTLPFMVCLARIQGEQLQLGQWILTGFAGEAALLEIVGSWIKSSAQLVSYNGKSFDMPLLITRYRLARQTDPFTDKAHIDLLHLTRRACGHGWDDCRLQTAEQRLLGFVRENDFPSHLIPQAWSEFVRGGGMESLNAIAEHNRHDVLSLAALLAMIAKIYAEPGTKPPIHSKSRRAMLFGAMRRMPSTISRTPACLLDKPRFYSWRRCAGSRGRTKRRLPSGADSSRTAVLQGSRLWPNTTSMSRESWRSRWNWRRNCCGWNRRVNFMRSAATGCASGGRGRRHEEWVMESTAGLKGKPGGNLGGNPGA